MALKVESGFSGTGFISGHTSDVVGGTWSPIASPHGSGWDSSLTGGILTTGSSSLQIWKPATGAGDQAQTLTLEYTPFADDWIAGFLLRVSGTSGYWVNIGPAEILVRKWSDTSDWGFLSAIASQTTGYLGAGDRSPHTLVASIDAAGVFTFSLDGVPFSGGGFASAVTDPGTDYTGTDWAFTARSLDITRFAASDGTSSGPTITGPLAGGGRTHSTLTQGRLAP